MGIESGLAEVSQYFQPDRCGVQLSNWRMACAGTLMIMPVEDDAFGSQTIKVGRGDPCVAIAADKADRQAARFDDEDLHTFDCSGAIAAGANRPRNDQFPCTVNVHPC